MSTIELQLAIYEALYQKRKFGSNLIQMINDLQQLYGTSNISQCVEFIETSVQAFDDEEIKDVREAIVEKDDLPLDLSIKKSSIYDDEDSSQYSVTSDVKEEENIQDASRSGECSSEFVSIGPNGTVVSTVKCENLKWDSAASATRQLLLLVFSEETLATHSLSGRPSPAFVGRERPQKSQLDPKKVNDIIYAVVNKFNVREKDVRAAITTKCADAAKMYKKRLQKQKKMEE